MPLGPGLYDPTTGIYLYGESDSESLSSDLLNVGQQSVIDEITNDRTRLTDLETDTAGLGDSGWIQVTSFSNSWAADTGQSVYYCKINGIVWLRGRLTGGTSATAFTLPVGYRIVADSFRAVLSGTNATVVNARVLVLATGEIQAVSAQQPNLGEISFPAV